MGRKPKLSFEQGIERIYEIVSALDTEDVSLTDSLKLYKEAVKTVDLLKDELNQANGKIILMRKDIDGLFKEDGVYDEL